MKTIDLQEQYEAIILDLQTANFDQAVRLVRKLNNLAIQIECEKNRDIGILGQDNPIIREMHINIC